MAPPDERPGRQGRASAARSLGSAGRARPADRRHVCARDARHEGRARPPPPPPPPPPFFFFSLFFFVSLSIQAIMKMYQIFEGENAKLVSIKMESVVKKNP